eukprot:760138_1
MNMSYQTVVSQSNHPQQRLQAHSTFVIRQTQHKSHHVDQSDPIRSISSLQSTHSMPSSTNNYHHNMHKRTTQTNAQSHYPMWGNSACSITTGTSTHPTTIKPTDPNYLFSLQRRLHVMIQHIHPRLANAIAPMIMKGMHENDIHQLLNNTTLLKHRIAKQMELLPDDHPTKMQYNRPPQNKAFDPSLIYINSAPTKPPWHAKHSSESHNYLRKTYKYQHQKARALAPMKSYRSVSQSRNEYSHRRTVRVKSNTNTQWKAIDATRRPIANEQKQHASNTNDTDARADKGDTMEVDDEEEYTGLPSICAIQILRVIVNTIIPKQIFELLLETLCVKKAKCA